MSNRDYIRTKGTTSPARPDASGIRSIGIRSIGNRQSAIGNRQSAIAER